MTIFLTVIQVICGLLLIGIIMMQSGKSAGLSVPLPAWQIPL